MPKRLTQALTVAALAASSLACPALAGPALAGPGPIRHGREDGGCAATSGDLGAGLALLLVGEIAARFVRRRARRRTDHTGGVPFDAEAHERR